MRYNIKAILSDEKQRARLLKGACEFLHKLECRNEWCEVCEERNTESSQAKRKAVQSTSN